MPEALNILPSDQPITSALPEPVACRNCSTAVSGDFCSACSQPVNVRRLTFRELWLEFMQRVMGLDGKFPRTLRDLTLQPGHVVQKFIDGNRVLYYGPIAYFFLVVTLLVLCLSLLDISFTELIASQQLGDTGEQDERMQRINAVIYDWMGRYFRTFSIAIVPVVAWVAGRMFRTSKLNFLEHTVLPMYITGHTFWVSTLSVILYKFVHLQSLGLITTLLTFFLFGLGYSQIMNYQGRTKAFFKGVLVYLLSLLIYLLIMIVGMTIVFFTDPELRKLFTGVE